MTPFVWTFHRLEAKRVKAPRWLVTWGADQSITVEHVIALGVTLETSDTMGALEGSALAYLRGRTLILRDSPIAQAGDVRVF